MAARTIQEGREALRTIRQRLLYPSPEAISACLPDLDRAVGCLSALGNDLAPVEGLRDELKRFKQEVREANALLRTGRGFTDVAEAALGVFPVWGVAASLSVGEEACCSTVSGIDTLLKAGAVPLPELSPRGDRYPRAEIEAVFLHLAEALKKRKVAMKPLLPLLGIVTPLVAEKPGGLLKGFMDKLQDRRLLATSDLRRSLRVKQVEESFESAGL